MFSLSPELYQSYYHHGMLLLVILTAVVYSQGTGRGSISEGFNSLLIWLAGGAVVMFLGTRPVSGVFIDMTTYAMAFEISQNTGRELYTDPGFNLLVELCGSVTTVEVFFVVCMLLYVVPIALGMQHAHREWAFAGFLAFAGAFSFFSYGVNGIRNGIATSFLIAAFALYDRKTIMMLLMAVAVSMHKSCLLPIVAFLVAGAYSHPWLYAVIWTGALAASFTFGEKLSNLFVGIAAFGDDERLSVYTGNAGFGPDKGGFRPDFVLYSIMPVILSYVLASAATRKDRFYRRLVCAYLLSNAFWVVVMYAAYSNRFAYLSWFLMPWIVIYPFLPSYLSAKVGELPQENRQRNLVGLALFAHFAFTYIMHVFVYQGRAG